MALKPNWRGDLEKLITTLSIAAVSLEMERNNPFPTIGLQEHYKRQLGEAFQAMRKFIDHVVEEYRIRGRQDIIDFIGKLDSQYDEPFLKTLLLKINDSYGPAPRDNQSPEVGMANTSDEGVGPVDNND